MKQPENPAALSAALIEANRNRTKIGPVSLAAMNRVLAHVPEDMTATVEAGITLSALQTALGMRGQWLPLDPPKAETITISELLAQNLSGPRRYGHGTARDHLLGMKVALADGTSIASGGKVVKNVAGYDLHKLFIGARGTLGIIVEATFKLSPLPMAERLVSAPCPSLVEAARLIQATLNSPLTPVVFDLHNQGGLNLVLGLAGSPEGVAWQVTEAARLGFATEASLEYERTFWAGTGNPQRLSVLPSTLTNALGRLADAPFVARAGNGVIYHRGPAQKAALPNAPLMQRLKDAFDPHHIFPALE